MSKRRFPGMKAADKFESYIPGTGKENFERVNIGLSTDLAHRSYVDRMTAAIDTPIAVAQSTNDNGPLFDEICDTLKEYKPTFAPWAVKSVLAARYSARRFVFDAEASERVGNIMQNNLDMISENAEFARPPYENMYVELDFNALYKGRGGDTLDISPTKLGFLFAGEWTYTFIQAPRKMRKYYSSNWAWMAFRLNRAQQGKNADYWREATPDLSKAAYILGGDIETDVAPKLTRKLKRFCENIDVISLVSQKLDIDYAFDHGGDPIIALTVLLLLNRPTDIVILKNMPATRIMRHNKSVAFAAHTVVNINLTAKISIRRVLMGDRASPRRHDVRGHWQHWHHVKTCEHEWQALTDKKTGMGIADKFLCHKCSTLRVWRKNFLRGDGSRGVVTKDYAVHK